MKYFILLLCLVTLQNCTQSISKKNIGEQIASANGFDNFNKIQKLEFIFNVQRDTSTASSRHWQWFPQTNDVVFITDSATTKFKRYDTTTPELKTLNAKFTNDEYWLLYPYHICMDKGCEVHDSSMKTASISGKSMQAVMIKYNDKEGFTPGDMYKLYLDENKKIKEWEYFKAGATEPSLVTTWENYKDFSGLQIAQDHKSKDGKFHLWFTGIQIQ